MYLWFFDFDGDLGDDLDWVLIFDDDWDCFLDLDDLGFSDDMRHFYLNFFHDLSGFCYWYYFFNIVDNFNDFLYFCFNNSFYFSGFDISNNFINFNLF